MRTDFDRLVQLYDVANDQTNPAEQRAKASELLAAINAGKLLAEYLALPENSHAWFRTSGGKGLDAPRYSNAKDLHARLCFESSYRFGQRQSPIDLPTEDDVIGLILCHRKYCFEARSSYEALS